jgi:hypothetical protein
MEQNTCTTQFPLLKETAGLSLSGFGPFIMKCGNYSTITIVYIKAVNGCNIRKTAGPQRCDVFEK